MADNTTTYNVVVETEVKGGDQVENLGNEAQGTGGKFKSLRTQIRETTIQMQKLADEGQQSSAEFENLRKKLDDLNDTQERVNFQAGQFDDQLAALPGPLGQIGSGIQSFNTGLNKFSLGFKVALGAVLAIVGAIAAFKESLSRTEEGQAKLNKLTEAFEKIMNGLFAVIEPIANVVIDFALALLENEKVMKGVSTTVGVLAAALQFLLEAQIAVYKFVINNLVIGFKTLADVAAGTGKIIKGVFTFDLDLIKKGFEEASTAVVGGMAKIGNQVYKTGVAIKDSFVDATTTGYDKASKSFEEGTKRMTAAEKEAAKERAEKAKEAREKAREEAKKLEEQRLKDLEAANKILTEAYLSGLEDRDKEIYKRGQKLNEDIAALEKAGITDRTAVLEAYNRDVAEINTKFDEEAKKKREEKQQKEYDEFKKGLDDKVLANENSYKQLLQNESDNLDKKLQLINEREQLLLSDTALTEAQRTQIVIDAEQARRDARTQTLDEQLMLLDQEAEALGTSFDRKRAIIDEKEAQLLSQAGLTEAQRTQIVRQAAEERKQIDMAELEAKAELQTAYLDLASGFGSFLKEIAGKNKKLAIAGVVVEQAAAIGKIIVNTGIANAKAVAASPLTFGAPWVAINTISAALSIASSVAAGIKAIQQIKNSDSGTPSSGGGASLPKSAGAAPTVPGVNAGAQTGIPQIVGTQGQATPGAQIAQTIGAAQNRPIRAYVISGDVTSQQALDRRTTRAATFSGGTNG